MLLLGALFNGYILHSQSWNRKGMVRLFVMLLLLTFVFADDENCKALIRNLRKSTVNHPAELINLQNSKCVVRLVPHYFWAQNMTHIHIKFRFASSLDSPACSQLLYFNHSVEHNGFQVEGLCVSSGAVMLYNLSVITWKSLNTHYCSWKSEEMSTKILECLKSPFPYFWETLHADQYFKSPNMHIWWDIYRKYREEVDNYMGLLKLEGEDD